MSVHYLSEPVITLKQYGDYKVPCISFILVRCVVLASLFKKHILNYHSLTCHVFSLTCVQEVFILGFGWSTSYPDILWFFLVSPGKCWDSTLKWSATSLTKSLPAHYSDDFSFSFDTIYQPLCAHNCISPLMFKVWPLHTMNGKISLTYFPIYEI